MESESELQRFMRTEGIPYLLAKAKARRRAPIWIGENRSGVMAEF